jgi:hypothetical protein
MNKISPKLLFSEIKMVTGLSQISFTVLCNPQAVSLYREPLCNDEPATLNRDVALRAV